MSTLNNPLDRVIVGFNVNISSDARETMEYNNAKVISGNVIYSMIDDLNKWLEILTLNPTITRSSGLFNVDTFIVYRYPGTCGLCKYEINGRSTC